MNYFFSILFLLIGSFTSVFSQKKIQLNGLIGIQGGELYSYDVELHSTSNPNEFTGIVKTFALADKEITAEVTLTIDRKKNTARLLETKIVYTKGYKPNASICLVDAALSYDEKTGVLKGPIMTQAAGEGAYCAIGNVIFTNTNEIQKLFNIESTSIKEESKNDIVITSPPNSKPNPNKPKYIEVQPNHVPEKTKVETENKPKEITHGKDAEIAWRSDKIILHIWDDNKVDGDKVTILYNGKEVLSNFTITSSPKILEFETGGSELNIITIIAMSEGTEPPNTAMIKLIDGDISTHDILSHNNVGKKSIIKIRRKI